MCTPSATMLGCLAVLFALSVYSGSETGVVAYEARSDTSSFLHTLPQQQRDIFDYAMKGLDMNWGGIGTYIASYSSGLYFLWSWINRRSYSSGPLDTQHGTLLGC